jgi:hypothetical protein
MSTWHAGQGRDDEAWEERVAFQIALTNRTFACCLTTEIVIAAPPH